MSTIAVTGQVIDPTKNPPSPKVWAVSIAMLVVPGLSAALLYLQTDQGAALYAALPVPLIVVLRSLLAGLTALLAGLRASDPQRVLDLATSPKVVLGVVVGLVAQAAVDLIAFLSAPEGQTLYAAWPPVLVVAFSAVLPGLSAWVAGYVKADPARLTPKNPNPQPIEPPPVQDVAPDPRPDLGLGGLPPRPITNRDE